MGTYNQSHKIFGGLSGIGLVDNILGAYRFLIHNYKHGDKIYLFGFGRSAFTAKRLGGLYPASTSWTVFGQYAIRQQPLGDSVFEFVMARFRPQPAPE